MAAHGEKSSFSSWWRRLIAAVANARLKTLVVVGGVLLALAGVATSMTVISLTNRMAEDTALLRNKVLSIRAAETVGLRMVVHARSDFLAHIADDPSRHELIKARAAKELEEAMRLLQQTAEATGESENAARIINTARAYLAAQEKADRENIAPIDAYQYVAKYISEVSQEVDHIVEGRMARGSTWDSVGMRFSQIEVVSSLAALAIIVVIAIVFVSARSLVYRPLVHLQKTIRRYHEGDASVRATPQGAIDLQELADAFNGMADDLGRRRESQFSFLSAVAHDLRNPLGAIMMSAELLRAKENGDNQESKQMLEMIRNQAAYLNRMVGDLLDTTRIEAGNLALKPTHTNLNDVVSESAVLYQNVSEKHTISLHLCDRPIVTSCDKVRVSQVVNNLISNAIKYSPEGGAIEVEVAASDKEAWIRVTDQGIGIADSDFKQIFEPFKRSSSDSHDIPGVGLGLSVAKRIIEAHGGTIRVVSAPGKGSTFTVLLPYVCETVTASAEAAIFGESNAAAASG